MDSPGCCHVYEHSKLFGFRRKLSTLDKDFKNSGQIHPHLGNHKLFNVEICFFILLFIARLNVGKCEIFPNFSSETFSKWTLVCLPEEILL